MGSPRRPSPWSATRPRRSQGSCGVHENQTKTKINFLTQTLLDYYYHIWKSIVFVPPVYLCVVSGSSVTGR